MMLQLIISIESVLLVILLAILIYTFIVLKNTKNDLQNATEHNKCLENLYDKVKGFKHDFTNIISVIDGYIENKDINGLKDYFKGIKNDCNIMNNLSTLNPKIINNPGIYSLLNSKYFKALESNVCINFNVLLDFNNLSVNIYEFSRILGILLDNAIEEAQKCNEKVVNVTFRNDKKSNRAIILIENSYSNKNIDIDKIFEKGYSEKTNHFGIGLWTVKKYISKSKNLDLFTSKNARFFRQELSIYN